PWCSTTHSATGRSHASASRGPALPTTYATGSAGSGDGGKGSSSRSATTTCNPRSGRDGPSGTVRSEMSSHGSMSNSRRTPPRSATHASCTRPATGLRQRTSSEAAPFTVELSMPNGYKIPPHFHPTDETVEVKKGTLLVGMGDTFDAASAKPMKAGEKGSLPANTHHFAAVKGATLIAVSAMGPFAMTYVNAADDPQQQVAKP